MINDEGLRKAIDRLNETTLAFRQASLEPFQNFQRQLNEQLAAIRGPDPAHSPTDATDGR